MRKEKDEQDFVRQFKSKKRQSRKAALLETILNNDTIRFLISLGVLLLIFVVSFLLNKQINISDLFEVKMVSSFVVAYLIHALVMVIKNRILRTTEDSNKLTNDYQKLNSMYLCDKIVYDNIYANKKNRSLVLKRTKIKNNNDSDTYTFPVTKMLYFKDKKVNFFYDKDDKYILPNEIKKTIITEEHKYSKIYNSLAIRVKDIQINNDEIKFYTQPTTYFNSLLTNRAMDYSNNTISIRNSYEYGPFLNDFKDSFLSNHLGFNGFVKTLDNKYID